MKKRFFTHAECGHCRGESTFRLLSERDPSGRTLMVCTVCGRRQPKPAAQQRGADSSSS
ncbi:MAG: hypothetical protein JWM64_1040 [Frankiales bacterium]|nr:hypothetical protein [Frankiales bacterium]